MFRVVSQARKVTNAEATASREEASAQETEQPGNTVVTFSLGVSHSLLVKNIFYRFGEVLVDDFICKICFPFLRRVAFRHPDTENIILCVKRRKNDNYLSAFP